jgi:hypothetical protein
MMGLLLCYPPQIPSTLVGQSCTSVPQVPHHGRNHGHKDRRVQEIVNGNHVSSKVHHQIHTTNEICASVHRSWKAKEALPHSWPSQVPWSVLVTHNCLTLKKLVKTTALIEMDHKQNALEKEASTMRRDRDPSRILGNSSSYRLQGCGSFVSPAQITWTPPQWASRIAMC